MTRPRVLALAMIAACLALLGVGAGALAQQAAPAAVRTIVVVHVVRNGHPAAGHVTIRDDDGHQVSCDVDADGECELQNVAAGRHVVEATGADGTGSGLRPVMIPEDGKVSLIVQLR